MKGGGAQQKCRDQAPKRSRTAFCRRLKTWTCTDLFRDTAATAGDCALRICEDLRSRHTTLLLQAVVSFEPPDDVRHSCYMCMWPDRRRTAGSRVCMHAQAGRRHEQVRCVQGGRQQCSRAAWRLIQEAGGWRRGVVCSSPLPRIGRIERICLRTMLVHS